LAIFTEADENYKPSKFEYNFFETELTYKYRIYKAIAQNENILLKSENPFALAILASNYALQSKNKEDNKLKFKIKLAQLLLQRNYNRDEIIEVFKFIDVLLELKNESNRKIYYEEVIKVANTKKKEIIGDFQKMAIKQGIEEGKLEVAKKLKEKGIDIKIIIETTGLTKSDIEKL
jgi:hypothetical protein